MDLLKPKADAAVINHTLVPRCCLSVSAVSVSAVGQHSAILPLNLGWQPGAGLMAGGDSAFLPWGKERITAERWAGGASLRAGNDRKAFFT